MVDNKKKIKRYFLVTIASGAYHAVLPILLMSNGYATRLDIANTTIFAVSQSRSVFEHGEFT